MPILTFGNVAIGIATGSPAISKHRSNSIQMRFNL